ncbi:MAG TPA: AI-2E family transporter [Polyangia bacterium]|jgi:predicted PurR-regulated permease PerM|nr:AI-2E family transporter [Polyangia bacterium]
MTAIDPAPGATTAPPAWTPRRLVLATLVAVAVAGAFALLSLAGGVLPYLVLGLVLAVSSEPAVMWLTGRGIPRHVAGFLVLALLVMICGGAALLLFPTVADQIGHVAERAPQICRSLRAWTLSRPSHLLTSTIQQALPGDCGLATVTSANWTAVESLGDPLWAAAAALVGAYAWITERATIQRGILKLVAPERRDAGRVLMDEIDGRLGAFVRGQALLSFIVGTVTTIFYLISGVPGALALGTIAAFAEVIPIAGPLMAAAVGVLCAAGTETSLIVPVIIFAAALRMASDYLLTPFVMGKSVGINPLLVLLTVVALGALGGVMGAMVAVPIAALLQMGLTRLLVQAPREVAPEGRDAVSLLRYRAITVALAARRMGRQRAAVGRDCTVEDAAELLALRTARLLSDAESPTPPQVMS